MRGGAGGAVRAEHQMAGHGPNHYCAPESRSHPSGYPWGLYLVVGEFMGPCSASRVDFRAMDDFGYFWRVPTWGGACPCDLITK